MDASAKLPGPAPEDLCNNLAWAVGEYNKQGFTIFQNGGLGITGDSANLLAAYTRMALGGALNARGYLHFRPVELDQLLARGVRGLGNDNLKLGGQKFFTDGSIQGFTGALLEDDYTRPGYKGELVWKREEINALIVKFHCLELQVAVHTNGDAATEAVSRVLRRPWHSAPELTFITWSSTRRWPRTISFADLRIWVPFLRSSPVTLKSGATATTLVILALNAPLVWILQTHVYVSAFLSVCTQTLQSCSNRSQPLAPPVLMDGSGKNTCRF